MVIITAATINVMNNLFTLPLPEISCRMFRVRITELQLDGKQID